MLSRTWTAEVKREATDVHHGRSILEALDPQLSGLVSLALVVPHNPQRKYAPYTVIIGWLGIQLGDGQKESYILERTCMHFPGVLLCVLESYVDNLNLLRITSILVLFFFF